MPQRWSRSLKYAGGQSRWDLDEVNARMYKTELFEASAEPGTSKPLYIRPRWQPLYNRVESKYEEDPAKFGYLVRKLRQFLYSFLRRARWRRLIKELVWARRMLDINVKRRLDFLEG